MSEEQNRLVGAVIKMSELPDEDKVNIRGKLYAEVHTRVQIFRETYGDDGKIMSTIHVADDTRVMAETSISVFVDGSWRVIANDFAEEYRASGPVNKTSAVENCLTSSIGRALSACGLSGGNYASFDEVNHAINDKAEAPVPKPKQPKVTPKPQPKPEPKVKEKAESKKNIEDYSLGDSAEISTEESAENLVSFMLQMATEFADTPEQLKEFYRANKSTIDGIDRDWHEYYEKLREGFSTLKNKLSTTEEVK